MPRLLPTLGLILFILLEPHGLLPMALASAPAEPRTELRSGAWVALTGAPPGSFRSPRDYQGSRPSSRAILKEAESRVRTQQERRSTTNAGVQDTRMKKRRLGLRYTPATGRRNLRQGPGTRRPSQRTINKEGEE